MKAYCWCGEEEGNCEHYGQRADQKPTPDDVLTKWDALAKTKPIPRAKWDLLEALREALRERDEARYEMSKWAEATDEACEAQLKTEKERDEARAALKWIATVNACDYEYVQVAREALQKAAVGHTTGCAPRIKITSPTKKASQNSN